jgi:2-oxoglutarate dehydrogenase E1 component
MDTSRAVHEAYKIKLLITAFMTHGHTLSDLDPLKLFESYKHFETFGPKFKEPPQELKQLLDYKYYGFTEEDLNREFYIDATELAGLLRRRKNWKLKELIEAYKNAYCSKIGVEYMHIPNREECNWIRDKFEGLQFIKTPREKKIHDYERLLWAD